MKAITLFILLFPTLAMASPQTAATANSVYEVIKDFQTLIAAVVGFSGVIFTMVVQGRQARAQRQYEAETAAKSMTQALDAKIMTLAQQLRINSQNSEGKPSEGEASVFPNRPLNHVFRALLPKFELLPPNEIVRIIRANMYYEQYFQRLSFFGPPTQQLPNHISVPSERFEDAQKLQSLTANWMEKPPSLKHE
ncbi:hypothetical protein [Ruegeria sp. HKCCD7255]|uniref:hypothetical protein n=1 Tax=Ruegeria sp. HKCCD7255 TaxID=2683004 RepID=UPI001488CAD4|nr:hypothetical protein [Ruegeria sp. HKCCD7255]